MTTRLARLWQPGNPQRRVFLPDFWLAVVESPTVGRYRLPPNCVKFEVDPRMSRHDIREYLTKIYGLKVRDVRTEVQMGDIQWNSPLDHRYKKAMWKENDKKFAYVFMDKDTVFRYPADDYFPVLTDEEQQVEKAKQQQDKLSQNNNFVNRDRKNIGEFFGI